MAGLWEQYHDCVLVGFLCDREITEFPPFSEIFGDIADAAKAIAAPMCSKSRELLQMVRLSRCMKMRRAMHKAKTGRDRTMQAVAPASPAEPPSPPRTPRLIGQQRHQHAAFFGLAVEPAPQIANRVVLARNRTVTLGDHGPSVSISPGKLPGSLTGPSRVTDRPCHWQAHL
jgi:hypothetical protein